MSKMWVFFRVKKVQRSRKVEKVASESQNWRREVILAIGCGKSSGLVVWRTLGFFVFHYYENPIKHLSGITTN